MLDPVAHSSSLQSLRNLTHKYLFSSVYVSSGIVKEQLVNIFPSHLILREPSSDIDNVLLSPLKCIFFLFFGVMKIMMFMHILFCGDIKYWKIVMLGFKGFTTVIINHTRTRSQQVNTFFPGIFLNFSDLPVKYLKMHI